MSINVINVLVTITYYSMGNRKRTYTSKTYAYMGGDEGIDAKLFMINFLCEKY